MIVVTVARKPLFESTVASNAVEHGTGAICISKTRISTSSNEPDSGAMFYKNRGLAMPENRHNYFRGEDGVAICDPIAGGRWPANLILEHRVGCIQEGSKRIKVVGATAHLQTHSTEGIAHSAAPHEHLGFRDAHGTETVDSWDCTPDCPVAALDGQTGTLQPSKGLYVRKHGEQQFLESGLGDGRTDGPTGVMDKGGASRFFKQVKSCDHQ